MGILDILTGGSSSDATEAMRKAQEAYENVRAPSAADLTLPELQQYVQAGLLTPAQATAVLNKQNAYDTTAVPTTGRNAQIAALNQLQDVANAKGMDATAQAQTQQTLNALNTNMQGQRGAILDSFAQRGVPLSLASEAMQNQVLGQDAQAANANALQANADAQMRALQALQGSATVGGNVQSQDWNQANTKAAAQNAINQWNSQVANTTNEANAARQQQANVYNTGTKQDIANQNTGLGNYRTEYNAKVPQQVFSNAIQKAGGQASAYQGAANLANQQGQQTTGLWKDIIGAAAPIVSKGLTPAASAGTGSNTQNPYDFDRGGIVPGHARNPGDSPANDTVPARLSPGELVVPRSIVREFVSNMPKKHGSAHPDDVKSVLKALTELRDKEIGEDDGAWSGGCTKGMNQGGMVKGYADGGLVDDPKLDFGDAFKPSKITVPPLSVPPLRGDLTTGSSAQMSAPVSDFLNLNVPNTVEKPQIPAQMAPIAANLPANAAPAGAIAPQSAGTDTGMSEYLRGLKANVGEYGPDKQKATLDFLNKQRNSWGNTIGQAMANFAGQGSQFAERGQKEFENALNQGKSLNEQNLSQIQSGMGIDAMDRNSAVSKQAQAAYGPLFEKLGYAPGAVSKMSAADIKTALSMAVEYGGKEKEAEIKQYLAQNDLDLKKIGLQLAAGQKTSELDLAEKKARQEAASERGKLGIVGGFLNPGAARVLEENAGLREAPKPGPLGQTTVRNGITYEWSPISGKYHPKGS